MSEGCCFSILLLLMFIRASCCGDPCKKVWSSWVHSQSWRQKKYCIITKRVSLICVQRIPRRLWVEDGCGCLCNLMLCWWRMIVLSSCCECRMLCQSSPVPRWLTSLVSSSWPWSLPNSSSVSSSSNPILWEEYWLVSGLSCIAILCYIFHQILSSHQPR